MIAKPDAAVCSWAEMSEWLHQRCLADPKCYRPRRMLAERPEPLPERPETDDRLLRALNEQVASLRKTVGQLEMEIRALRVRATQAPTARTTPPVTRPAPTKPKTLLDSYER